MRLDVVGFVAVPVAAFTLTCAILLHQQRAARDTPGTLGPGAAPDLAIRAAVRPATPLPPSVMRPTASVPEARPAMSPAARATASPPVPPAADTAAELPVRISFPEAPASSKQQAVVLNESADTLDVTLTVQNETTGKFAQVPFSLGPHAVRKFGLHDDPKLESGDHVVLQSAPYRDVGDRVP